MEDNNEFGYKSEMHDIVSGIADLLRDSSNIAQDISTIMYDLDQIRKMQKSDVSQRSKGEYKLEEGQKGTIYEKHSIQLLEPLLDIKHQFWNQNYRFISWEELFSKMDKIDMILEDLRSHKSELEDILLKSKEIETRLDTVYKYQLGLTKK